MIARLHFHSFLFRAGAVARVRSHRRSSAGARRSVDGQPRDYSATPATVLAWQVCGVSTGGTFFFLAFFSFFLRLCAVWWWEGLDFAQRVTGCRYSRVLYSSNAYRYQGTIPCSVLHRCFPARKSLAQHREQLMGNTYEDELATGKRRGLPWQRNQIATLERPGGSATIFFHALDDDSVWPIYATDKRCTW